MCLSSQLQRFHRFPSSRRFPLTDPLPEQPTRLVLVLAAAAGSGDARSRGGVLECPEIRKGGRQDGVPRRRRRHWRRLRRRLTPRARLPTDRLRVCACACACAARGTKSLSMCMCMCCKGECKHVQGRCEGGVLRTGRQAAPRSLCDAHRRRPSALKRGTCTGSCAAKPYCGGSCCGISK